MTRFIVLAAVELDDETAIEADEIDDVIPQGNLSPKLESCKPTTPQLPPDERLGLGLIMPEFFGAIAVFGH
jgi:hypothetical protein